jgi:hypothetical protein
MVTVSTSAPDHPLAASVGEPWASEKYTRSPGTITGSVIASIDSAGAVRSPSPGSL